MTRARIDLTGQWTGDYAYPAHMLPATPFLARIEDHGGHLSGTIIEPSLGDGTTIEARIEGHRHGATVDFVKQYGPDAPAGYQRPVDYVGRLSTDGTMITGVWSLLDMDGTFEMHRDVAEEALVEDREEAELPLHR